MDSETTQNEGSIGDGEEGESGAKLFNGCQEG